MTSNITRSHFKSPVSLKTYSFERWIFSHQGKERRYANDASTGNMADKCRTSIMARIRFSEEEKNLNFNHLVTQIWLWNGSEGSVNAAWFLAAETARRKLHVCHRDSNVRYFTFHSLTEKRMCGSQNIFSILRFATTAIIACMCTLSARQ